MNIEEIPYSYPKKKVDPNFQITDNSNKVSTPKPRLIEPAAAANPTSRSINQPTSVDIDDDTKFLMALHEQIVPSPNLVSVNRFASLSSVQISCPSFLTIAFLVQLNTVEQFITVIEAALKSCSGQLLACQSDTDPSGTLR